MKSVNPYVFIENCQEALDYYQGILGGEVKDVQSADGIEGFEGHEGKILHAILEIGNSVLHFSDIFGSVTKGDNIKITLELESKEEIQNIYDALVAGGQADLKLQETFWGAWHANVTDKYGVGWLLNYQK